MSQCECDQILVHSAVRSEVDVADSEIKGEDGEESVEETHSGDSSQEDEPEVESNVDLLIDDVQRENTQSICLLDGSRGTIELEVALGNFGEDLTLKLRL